MGVVAPRRFGGARTSPARNAVMALFGGVATSLPARTMTDRSADSRHDGTVDEIVALHDIPRLEIVGRANAVLRAPHDPDRARPDLVRDAGAERVFLGAARKRVRDGREFDAVAERVAGVRDRASRPRVPAASQRSARDRRRSTPEPVRFAFRTSRPTGASERKAMPPRGDIIHAA